MLTKNNKTQVSYISRLLVLPLAVIVFAAFTLKAKTYITSLPKDKTIIVVLDAGHGGTDNGGVAEDGSFEKDINLALIKKIKDLNQDANVKIILTRESDIYMDPKAKANFAKENNADLFISVHGDLQDAQKTETESGLNVFVSKNNYGNNIESKLLASVIVNSFENKYGLPVTKTPQQREKGIWVLQANTFPSVLIEAGFLSNKKDVDYLKSEEGQNQFARNVLAAIESYAAESKKNIFEKTDGIKSAYSQKDTIPGEINFSVKKLTVKNNGNIKEDVVTIQGNVLLEKKDTEKMLVIINGKRVKITALHNVTIQSKTAKIYNANNKEAISQYGDEAVNGVIILDGANFEKNNETLKETTIIRVDSATMIVTVAAKDELPLKDTTKPLYVVNGVVKIESDLKTIPSGNIEQINVLKNKNATDKYGDKGMNGVLEITTEKKQTPALKLSGNSSADKVSDTAIDDKIFTSVETEAQFPGGNAAWRNYLVKKLDAGMPVTEGWKTGTYTIVTQFIVYKNGEISDIITKDYPGSKTAQMCIDLIKKGPRWAPAMQNGQIVKAYRRQPITFVVSEN